MALIIPVGFAQAAYRLRLAEDPEDMVTTCGHDISGISGGDFEAIANLLHERFATHLMDMVSTAYSFQGLDLYVGQDGGPPAVFESTLGAVTGGSAGVVLPQNCAYLVRKRTSASGRRGRGRMYIPGVPAGGVSGGGTVSSGQLTGAQTAAEDWYDSLTDGVVGSPTPPVILHRSEGIGEEPPPTPVVTLTVDPSIATQRRRLRP